MKKVLLGMSGGVDSSVAAKILIDLGYYVTGVTMKLFEGNSSCCSLSDVEDARSVCIKLGIEHLVFNFKDDFQKHVIDKFVNTYLAGGTPSPCIDCNRYLKFDKMLARAETLGYDYIATGHYAKKVNNSLYCADDSKKDQTYFLYPITQYQLSKTLFPLGNITKDRVREIAEENGFLNARKPDSQDICFVGEDYNYEYANLIAQKHPLLPGDFTDISGNVLGRHKGLVYYTIGQRKGLGISAPQPLYVIGKDTSKNTVILGKESDLYSTVCYADDLNLLENLSENMKISAKTRYSQKSANGILNIENGIANITFEQPQRAITKGQAVVFYDNGKVLGGGTII